MAKMLIRTRRECDNKIAFLLRVSFFVGIPFIYFVFVCAIGTVKSASGGVVVESNIIAPDFEDSFSTRHLLGLAESGKNCTPAAILEFPPDGLTHKQRRSGFIVIHCILAIYCFLLLGTVCEQYFVPAIDMMCDRFDMSSDVAGATFMAAASSSPELFINCVGTFVTEGDLGVGAIVGSAVFNVLAVPACCALFTSQVIELDWWSVSRDCLMYAVTVVALILTLLDDKIYWHEALLLVLMYTFYILAMVFNKRLGKFVRSGCCVPNKPKVYTEITPLLIKDKQHSLDPTCRMNMSTNDLERGVEMARRHDSETSDVSSISSLWSWPDEKASTLKKLLWVVTWPIGLLLWATVPDCRRYPRLYPLTFVMCVSWIGGVSYLVAWIITIVGDTLDVPDSITGLTILAAGTSLPEAVSSVLVTKNGHGNMGISNSIGSNTFDILLCLGLPWLVKALFYPSVPENYFVSINSSGLSYSAISLLSTLFTLYGALALNKFQLDWKIGVICIVAYAGYIVFAALIELNVFFLVNLPICPH
ncbi:unnamed protein product [Chilo suppressalis]|uniref:Sodium/calcium exchanger membrane region domain-containing protein n=1 Tax=Chilo suppressalis TaxID=168631 RepID=A0ABN8L8N2_CHISP|nr:unnamed protein product [Chilo suppressalis]